MHYLTLKTQYDQIVDVRTKCFSQEFFQMGHFDLFRVENYIDFGILGKSFYRKVKKIFDYIRPFVPPYSIITLISACFPYFVYLLD